MECEHSFTYYFILLIFQKDNLAIEGEFTLPCSVRSLNTVYERQNIFCSAKELYDIPHHGSDGRCRVQGRPPSTPAGQPAACLRTQRAEGASALRSTCRYLRRRSCPTRKLAAGPCWSRRVVPRQLRPSDSGSRRVG